MEQRDEKYLRYHVSKLGYRLEKCRVRDTTDPWWGTFQIVDQDGSVVAGLPGGFGLTVDEVYEWIFGPSGRTLP